MAVATALLLSWLHAQPLLVFEQASIDAPDFDDVLVEQAWRARDGSIISELDAQALAPADPAIDYWQRLTDRGYETVQLGVTAETARGWLPLEIAGTTLVGLALVGATVAIVDRRRPTWAALGPTGYGDAQLRRHAAGQTGAAHPAPTRC